MLARVRFVTLAYGCIGAPPLLYSLVRPNTMALGRGQFGADAPRLTSYGKRHFANDAGDQSGPSLLIPFRVMSGLMNLGQSPFQVAVLSG